MSGDLLLQSDAFLFDIDGTLLNVSDATQYFAFINAMREVFHVDCDLSGVLVHGNSDIGILRAALRNRGIGDEEFEENIERAIAHMCAEVAHKASEIRAVPCSSVQLVLNRLRANDKLLGVVSVNLEPIGWAKLEAAGIREFFQFGAFSANFSRNGEASSPMLRFLRRAEILSHGIRQVRQRLGTSASICVIGDTPSDIEAARETGVPIIAVSTGTFSHEQLQALSPHRCVKCLDELLA